MAATKPHRVFLIVALALVAFAVGAEVAAAKGKIPLGKVTREAREFLGDQCGGPDRCVSKRFKGCERTSRTRARCRGTYVFTDAAGTTRADTVTRWKKDGRKVEVTNIDTDFEPLD